MAMPSVLVQSNIVCETNPAFVDLTGYSFDEVVGITLSKLSEMLRLHTELSVNINMESCNRYLFTKDLLPIEVEIEVQSDLSGVGSLFVFKEKSNSRLEDKMTLLRPIFQDNYKAVAIFSVPELILLRANLKYISIGDPPFSNEKAIIGKTLKEYVKGYSGSVYEACWNEVLNTGITKYIREFKITKPGRKTTYWDSIQSPILEEGRMKYILLSSEDVTDRVEAHQRINDQNEVIQRQNEELEHKNQLLEAIINNIDDAILLYDKQNRLFMENRPIREFCGENLGKRWQIEYYDLAGNEISVNDRPVPRILRGDDQGSKI